MSRTCPLCYIYLLLEGRVAQDLQHEHEDCILSPSLLPALLMSFRIFPTGFKRGRENWEG